MKVINTDRYITYDNHAKPLDKSLALILLDFFSKHGSSYRAPHLAAGLGSRSTHPLSAWSRVSSFDGRFGKSFRHCASPSRLTVHLSRVCPFACLSWWGRSFRYRGSRKDPATHLCPWRAFPCSALGRRSPHAACGCPVLLAATVAETSVWTTQTRNDPDNCAAMMRAL